MKIVRKFRFKGFKDGGTYSFDPEVGDVYDGDFRSGEDTHSVRSLALMFPDEWEEVFRAIEVTSKEIRTDFREAGTSRLINALREAEQAIVKLGEEIVKLREIIQDEKTN